MTRRKKGKTNASTRDDVDPEIQETSVPQQSSSPHQSLSLNDAACDGSRFSSDRTYKNAKGKAKADSRLFQMQESTSCDRSTYQPDSPPYPVSNHSLAPTNFGPSGGFFEGTNGVGINGGKFNQTYGHQTNVTIQFQPQRDEEFNAPQPQQSWLQPSISPSQVTRPNTTHEYQSRQSRFPTLAAYEQGPQMSQTIVYSPDNRKIYEHHLGLKQRGLPLWIPHLNRRSPMPYRRKGVSIGDVGIITPSGGFSFLFNICLPHNHPINPQVLPEDFAPIPMDSLDIRELLEFSPESYLASTSIEKVHDDTSSFRGLSFKTSAAEGAVLTLPEGAIAFDLENISRFRAYAAENLEKWYRYVNGPRGREAKNGDVRLVIGCDKVTSWGIAAVANMTHQTTHYLKFRSLEGGSTVSASPIPLYKWEYSGMAEAKVGPELEEIEELKRNDDSDVAIKGKYWNQCTFVRTLNPALNDRVFTALNRELEAPFIQESQQHMGTSGHNSSPNNSPNSNSQTSNTTQRFDSNLGMQRGSSESSGSSKTELPSGNVRILKENISVSRSTISPQSHPADVLNRLLLENVPNGRIVITQDKDWFSVVNEDDKIMPSPSKIAERVLAANYIREDNGVISLEPKEKTPLTIDNATMTSNISDQTDPKSKMPRSPVYNSSTSFVASNSEQMRPPPHRLISGQGRSSLGDARRRPVGPPPGLPLPDLPANHVNTPSLATILESSESSTMYLPGSNSISESSHPSSYASRSASPKLSAVGFSRSRQASFPAVQSMPASMSSSNDDLSELHPQSYLPPSSFRSSGRVQDGFGPPDRTLLAPSLEHSYRSGHSMSSRRGALARALELAREAVQIDFANDNPEAAVNAYAQSVALLNEVMESVRNGEDTVTGSHSRRQAVVAQEELRRLRSVHDTYADRMNILMTIYGIPEAQPSPTFLYGNRNSSTPSLISTTSTDSSFSAWDIFPNIPPDPTTLTTPAIASASPSPDNSPHAQQAYLNLPEVSENETPCFDYAPRYVEDLGDSNVDNLPS